MLDSLYLPVLMAQEQTTFTGGVFKFLYFIAIVALVIVLPIMLGSFVAKWLRMRGYEWKLGLIFVTLAIASLIVIRAYDFEKRKFRMPMGVDLKGGVVLIYEIDLGGGPGLDPDAIDPDAIDPDTGMRGTGLQGGGSNPDPAAEINMGDLMQALTNRINPSGTKEIVIRQYGDRQVEIIIPEVEADEVQNIKRQISTAGMLEFRIVANDRDHKDIIALAEEQAQNPDPARRVSKDIVRRVVVDGVPKDEKVGFWAQAAKEKLKAVELEGNILRNSVTGEMIDRQLLTPVQDNEQQLEDYLTENKLQNVDFLVAKNDGCDVTGDYLGMVAASTDEYLSPCVNFRMQGEGVGKFQLLTSSNLPDMDSTPPFYRHLGIILDERIISFPRLITTISDNGRITGNFTQDEVNFLVGILRAGKLPATLKKVPISENHIGSMLGDDTIQKGKTATTWSLIAVFVFMAIFYRFSGLVACAALAANLLYVFAIMILLNAPLTLPGLAGLCLTVGMAVDGNVLIFERLREEMARGTGLRMAIRNGFDKAMSAIVDSNLTTVITAVVLYVIGTDQLRGFAVTLTLGILASMFTAVFCSRVVFDIAERRGWIKGLRMMRLIGATNIDFIGKCGIAVAGSLVVIMIGLVALAVRGQTVLDIDFTGGVSVTMVLQDSLPPDEVRGRLNDHFESATPPVTCTVNTVSVEERPEDSVYKIDANLTSADDLERAIEETFRNEGGQSLLLSYTMDYFDVKQLVVPSRAPARENAAPPPAEKSPAAPAPAAEASPEGPATEGKSAAPPAEATPATPAPPPQEDPATQGKADAPESVPTNPDAAPGEAAPAGGPGVSLRGDLPPDSLLAWAGPTAQDPPETTPETTPEQTAPAEEPKPPAADEAAAEKAEAKTAPPPAADSGTAAAAPAPPAEQPAAEITTVARLVFGNAINAPTLRQSIERAFGEIHPAANDVADATPAATNAAGMRVPGLFVDTDEVFEWDQTSGASSKEWYVRMTATEQQAEAVLQRMKQDLASTPVFPSSSTVGGQVAGDSRSLAIYALIASWIGVIIYVWVRFQNLIFGLAAVIALVHDVLITVTAIAISAYLTGVFGFLLVDDFKINLTIVAALLTIIGYSINDTIVIYDRIREIRGKSVKITAEMINNAINQTFARTILTAWTVFLVVFILYVFGGTGIHGFAYAMLVGTIVGAYSTVFIAAPIVLWMLRSDKKPTAE